LTVNRYSANNLLRLRVHPNAKQNEIAGFIDDVLHIKVSAPPVKGKANRELTAFLSEILGLSRSSLTIVKGHTSRNKVIAVDGLSQEDVIKRLTT
jgi:uncharacterized protein (TIGR00251 family)